MNNERERRDVMVWSQRAAVVQRRYNALCARQNMSKLHAAGLGQQSTRRLRYKALRSATVQPGARRLPPLRTELCDSFMPSVP